MPANLVKLARRKAEGEVGAETDNLLGRVRILADRFAVGIKALKYAHGLKEGKPVCFLKEDLF